MATFFFDGLCKIVFFIINNPSNSKLQLFEKLSMFLTVYWLKSMISIGIVITLILGVVLLYVLVYAFLVSSVTAQILPDFRNGFIGIFMSLSILMILSSLSGIYGIISTYFRIDKEKE